MKNYEILGIDVGNAAVKTSEGIIFDSLITDVEPLGGADKIKIGGKTYYIGIGNYDTTYRKVDKTSYIVMLLSAIALSTDSYIYLVLGLPLSQYKQDKSTLINMILAHSNELIELNGITKKIDILDVEVFPEGVVTLADDFEGIVIDIGGRTTDCALVTNIRNKRKINNPLSLPIGVINLYTDFIKSLNNVFGLDLKLEDAERILKNGLIVDGEKKDIDFATDVYKKFVDELVTTLQVEYSLRTNKISLTGGGATILFEYFKDRLGQGVEVQDNPVMANAISYKELGESLWQQ